MSIFSFLIPLFIAFLVLSNKAGKSRSGQDERRTVKKYPMPPVGRQWMPKEFTPVDHEPKQQMMDPQEHVDITTSSEGQSERTDATPIYMSYSDNAVDEETYHHKKGLPENKPINSRPTKKTKRAMTLDSKNIRDGIILAELLGPPRSRNPHPAMKKR